MARKARQMSMVGENVGYCWPEIARNTLKLSNFVGEGFRYAGCNG